MADSAGQLVAVIETTAVRVLRLAAVDLAHALGEGEGYTTVAGWRAAHEEFWHSPQVRAERGDPEFTVNDDTLVVAEAFRLIPELRRGRQRGLQDAGFAAQAGGAVGVASFLVLPGRDQAVGDLGPDDLLGFGGIQPAPFRLSGTQAGRGAGDMDAAGTGAGRWSGRDGAGVVEGGQGRAQRRGGVRVPCLQGLPQGQLQALSSGAVIHTATVRPTAVPGR